ncbi:Aminotransferase class-III [Metarhizium album ARSEF 1941]|uniref:Aminotransferase class-III n=1 Tax=Metarhizium album (strain ARSEF 1941) TaxID=1081103 RepID=A0A0B2WM36_METAS|nr:Aminotransferase class-III [Metarhizium album ARSEF 1941]KHN95013.1 Aminotransferase class-III [Metarhizium album ARSEF 1941]
MTDAAPDSKVLHRSLLEHPETVTSADGSYFTLSNGQRILDGCGGAAVAAIGHGDADVKAAVMEQMSKVAYAHTLAFTTSSAEELADTLLDGNPFGLCRAYFVASGSEAVDAAMKLARQYWVEAGQPHRRRFVARRQAYHGSTIGSMSVGSHVGRQRPYKDALLLNNVSYVSPTYAYRVQRPGETEGAYARRLVAELEAEFEAVGPETIMAFVAETVGGATVGCITPPRGYFEGVRRACDRHGILLILDEVMCGSGRTGTYFAFAQEGDVRPDMVTLGKGLGGGYTPMAGVLVHRRVVDVLARGSGTFVHGHTYQAHPVCCAAALAVQRVLKRDRLVAGCAEKGKWLEARLRERLGPRRYVGDIRGRGLFWALEFVKDKETKEPFAPRLCFASVMRREAHRLGLAIYPGSGTADGQAGDHVVLAPPLNATWDELGILVDLLESAYDVVEKTLS